jgi:hypothetical protein
MDSIHDRIHTERGLCRAVRPRKAGPSQIFISYRWSDAWAECQLLHHDLALRFGERNVFIDTERIDDGEEIGPALRDALHRSDVVLAVMGPTWLDVRDGSGRRRLDDRNDVIREELELARELNLRLIPVLLHGTQPPLGDVLPGSLRWIQYRKAVWLHRDTWRTDVGALVERLGKQRPRNRFAGWSELGDLTRTRGGHTHRFRLALNALAKPCAIAFGGLVAIIGLLTDESALVPVGIASYLFLALVAFFTLYEAETIGARERSRSAS